MLNVECFPTRAMDSSRYIAKHVINLPRSGIRDFFEIVAKMKDVISLGIGEPDFDAQALTRAAPEQRDALPSETPRLNPAGVPRTNCSLTLPDVTFQLFNESLARHNAPAAGPRRQGGRACTCRVNAPATADHYSITGSGADAAWGAALATE